MARFRDFSGRYDLPVARMPQPRDLTALRREVLDAERDRLGVSAVGAGWAFSAPAYNPGVVIDTSLLSGYPAWLQDCVRQPRSGPEIYAAVAAGTQVRKLYLGLMDMATREALLARVANPPAMVPIPPAELTNGRSLAPPTLGGAGGQTLGGVVSTGTHGGDVARPPIGDYVRAAVLVGSGGRVRVVQSRADRPVDVDRLNRLYRDQSGGAEFEEYLDEDGLAAVTTSVGRLGVVYAYVYAVHDETAVSVYEWRYQDRWSRVRADLESGGILRQARTGDEFLQVALSPLRTEGEDPVCWVTRHLTRPSAAVDTVYADFGPGRLTPTSSQDVLTARRSEVFELLGQLFGVDRVTPQIAALRQWLYLIAAIIAGVSFAAGAAVGSLAAGVGALVGGAAAALAALPVVCAVRGLADDLGTLNEHRLFGDVLTSSLNRLNSGPYGFLSVAVINGLLASNQSATRPDGQPWLVHGPRGVVMDGYDYRGQPLYRGDSVEVFFRADEQLGARVEALFDVMANLQRQGKPLAAYVSLRFLAASKALLATTDPDPRAITCSMEISMLRGMRGNDEALDELQAAAIHPDQQGRVHWGQENELASGQVAASIPRLERWKSQLRALEGQSTTFLTPFALAHGLDVERGVVWDGWQDLGLHAGSDAYVASGGGGFTGTPAQYAVLAIDGSGKLQLNRQQSDRVGTDWHLLADRLFAPSCAPTADLRHDDGRLEIFAVTAGSEVGHVYQLHPGGDEFSSVNVKTRLFGHQQLVGRERIASAQRSDGNLKVYAVAAVSPYRLLQCGNEVLNVIEDVSDREVSGRFSVRPRSFRPPGHGWSHDTVIVAVDSRRQLVWRLHEHDGWDLLGPPDEPRQVVQLAGWVVVTTTDSVWAAADVAPDEGRPVFGPWQRLPDPIDEPIALDNPLGTVSVGDGGWLFTLTRTGRLVACRLRGGVWEGWTGLGGRFAGGLRGARPAAGQLPDGRIQVVVRRGSSDPRSTADRLMARRQVAIDTW